jgi:hypothetical protein
MTDEDQIRQSIEHAVAHGRVACELLLELAERTATPPKRIGQLCDEMDIRISNCQLGCFR